MHLLDQLMVKHLIRKLHTLVVYKLTLSSLTGESTETILMELVQDLVVGVQTKTTMALLATDVEIGLQTN
jgi:hypothetical protein